jgi:transcriptional regulator with XRE-family HTH domain
MEESILARNLVFLRKNKGWKQSEMEDRCGIKQRNWSNWENAVSEPDISTLLSIADVFGVKVDSLLKEDISKNTHLIDKTTYAIYAKKHTPKSTPIDTPKNENVLAEDEEPRVKKEINLLILEQLKALNSEVSRIRKKLDE